jgi:CheY-like chemotaxis protein
MTSRPEPVRVLVVDDDTMSRELLGVLLEGEGYEVEASESGDAALTLLRGGHPVPEIVLTDMQMPGTSGARLAVGLRRICGSATILLAMSGSGLAPEAISRFDGFLMKPFTMRQLAETISEASAVRAASREAAASNPGMDTYVQEPRIDADSETGTIPALDERIYKQLTEAMPAPQLHQMYAMCMKDARDRIATMRALAAERDGAQFIRQAHSIKGGCGMLGATQIYGMAARLESSGLAAAGLEGAQGVNPLDELAAACDRLERILGSRAQAG